MNAYRDKKKSLQRLLNEEDGAAYTLSYVMVIPVYAILMCMIIESVLMLSAKMGTVYAAYAAARTASVWSSATSWDKALTKSKQAAIQAMVPFASGMQPKAASTPQSGDIANSANYIAAYKVFAKQSISTKQLLAKYGYATRHMTVTIDGPPAHWDSEIKAKVTYEFPFNVPGIGRLFGRRGADGGTYFTITSEASVPNEGPQDDRKTIGIGYGTLE
jgi:Flp pilus assembly protein TadG